MSEEFYVGYLETGPPETMRRVRRLALAAVALAALVGFGIAALQKPLGPARFEFGVERSFEGRVSIRPYPLLSIRRPNSDTESSYLLVAPGKHGAGELVADLDGRRVELRGALIHRGDRTMIELVPGSVRDLGEAHGGVRIESMGPPDTVFVGEIVDSKCHLGVMNPGDGKVHRACATLCIRGGIPPIFVARDAQGRVAKMLLVGSDWRTLNDEVLEFVAETVQIRGEVVRQGDLLFLLAEPDSIRRLNG